LLTLFGVAHATVNTPFFTAYQTPTVCAQLESGGIGSWVSAKEADIRDQIVAHSQVETVSQTLYCEGYNIPVPHLGATDIEMLVIADINQSTDNLGLWHWKLYPEMAGESVLTNPSPWPAPILGIQQVVFTSSFNVSNSRTEFGLALNVEDSTTVWVDSMHLGMNYLMRTTVISAISSTNEIIVYGTAFWDNPNIMCKIDTLESQGTFLSPTSVVCPFIASPGLHTIEIAPNGNSYTTNGIIFGEELTTTTDSSSSSNIQVQECGPGCITGIAIGFVLIILIASIVYKKRPPLGGCIEKNIPGHVSSHSERSSLAPIGPPREFKKNKTHTRPASGTTSLNRSPSEYLSRNRPL
jgi:hypothetical protein